MSSANIFKGQRQVPIFTGELKNCIGQLPDFFNGNSELFKGLPALNVLGSRFQLPLGPLLLTPVFG